MFIGLKTDMLIDALKSEVRKCAAGQHGMTYIVRLAGISWSHGLTQQKTYQPLYVNFEHCGTVEAGKAMCLSDRPECLASQQGMH